MNLLHMRNGASIVRFERANNLESRGQDPDDATGAAKEDIVRAGGNASYVPLLLLSVSA